jgi:uncharacterized membrane protein required for colicin V production
MGTIDLIIIGIIGLFLIIGIAKGFMKQILSAANWLIALIGSFLLIKPVSALVAQTALKATINTKVGDWIASKGALFSTTISTGQASQQLTEAISELGLPEFIAKAIVGGLDLSSVEGSTLAEVLAPTIGNIILTVLTFLALFILLMIICKVVFRLLNKVFDSGVLGVVNRILGAALGLVKGAVLVSLAMLLVSALSGLIPSLNDFLTADLRLGTEGFGIGKYFYENNPIMALIKGSFNFKDILEELV